MLEEALRNEKSHPSEVALAMLSFIQNELPAGGSAAESRFFDLYGPLCERIFGPILGPQDGFRHKDGGWLSAQSPWARLPSAVPPSPRQQIGSTVGLSRTSASALDAEPVVKLLGTAGNPKNSKEPLLPTLVEAISKESENRPSVGFALRIDALPKPIQDAWFALVEASMGGKPADCSENDLRLFGTLLRKRPEEQNQLKLFRQRAAQKLQQDPLRQPLHLSPRGFNASIPMQLSPSSRNPQPPSPTKKPLDETPPNAMLSMLEYYLFLFLRFPLAAPDHNKTLSSSVPGVNVHRVAIRGATSRAQRESFGDSLYYYIFRRCMRHFLPYEREDDRWIDFADLRESELFLRILIAMWLESRARLIPTPKVVHTINERRQHAGLDATKLDLNASYDLVQQVALKYEPLPAQVHKSLRALIIHVVLDPAISRNVLDKDLTARTWCLTSCMTALQQPVYNLVRTAFRYASVHSSDSSFFGALNTWLIWLEPWNLMETRKHDFSPKNAKQRIIDTVAGTELTQRISRALTLPKYNQASKYQASWEPYIAANLFMYTVPFAIFLRRARELDFSAGKFDRSIEIVKRVFRVFSPEVVDAVSRHLDSSQSSRFSHLVKRHTEVLGEFGPPSEPMSLSSFKADMQSLLEEIDMQHFKKVRELDTLDWMVGKVEGLFGKGVVSGEEKKLESLVERAKLIARLPIDYEILPQSSIDASARRTDAATADKRIPVRTDDGFLSSVGREQVYYGDVRCDLADAPYCGDKMRARVRSHELSLLVDLTIWASDALNKKFGLSGEKGSFRFNLRFLADYRNAAFVVITMYLFFKILRW